MPRIKIVCPDCDEPTPRDGGLPHFDVFTGLGTQVFIDGVEIHHVKSIRVSPIESDAPLVVTLELIASHGSEIDIPAVVNIEQAAPLAGDQHG